MRVPTVRVANPFPRVKGLLLHRRTWRQCNWLNDPENATKVQPRLLKKHRKKKRKTQVGLFFFSLEFVKGVVFLFFFFILKRNIGNEWNKIEFFIYSKFLAIFYSIEIFYFYNGILTKILQLMKKRKEWIILTVQIIRKFFFNFQNLQDFFWNIFKIWETFQKI